MSSKICGSQHPVMPLLSCQNATCSGNHRSGDLRWIGEEAIERQEVEEVFYLGGGELSDEPWIYTKWIQLRPDWGIGQKQEHTSTTPYLFRHWYDGVPEYATSDFKDSSDEEYRTACYCRLYGGPSVGDTIIDSDGNTWECASWFPTSGETECPFIQMTDDDEADGEEGSLVNELHCINPEQPDCCFLCEESRGEPHRYIYLGDGWGEGVFKMVLSKENADNRELIKKLNREQYAELLEAVDIQVYDHEDLATLSEAVRVNVEDETISIDDVRALLG